jgi:hypothetical protein
MVEEKDRFGETMKLVERAKEDIYFAQRDRELIDGRDLNLGDVTELVTDATRERPERGAAFGEEQLRARLLELVLDRSLRSAELRLRSPQLAHVTRDEDDALQLAMIIDDGRGRDGHRNALAVLREQERVFASQRLTALDATTHDRAQPGRVVVEECRDGQAAELGARSTREPRGARVGERDAAVGINRDDGVDHRLEDEFEHW